MCRIDIFIVFFDRESQKFTEFSTEPFFNSKTVEYLLREPTRRQFACKRYTNQDYATFCNDKERDCPEPESDCEEDLKHKPGYFDEFEDSEQMEKFYDDI